MNARLCDVALQSGCPSLTPCQALFAPRSNWFRTDALAFGVELSQTPLRVEQRHKPMHIGMLREQRPVKPTGFVVLAIGVVVAALGAPRLRRP